MTNPHAPLPGDGDPLDHALDHALAAALPPPPLPAGFQARLRDALLADAASELKAGLAAELARQRRQLEDEHRRALARLHRGHLRVRRETLAVVLAVAFTAGAAVAWAAPWLREALGVDLSLLLPLVAVGIGMGAGAAVWVQRLGWPGWPRGLAWPRWLRG